MTSIARHAQIDRQSLPPETGDVHEGASPRSRASCRGVDRDLSISDLQTAARSFFSFDLSQSLRAKPAFREVEPRYSPGKLYRHRHNRTQSDHPMACLSDCHKPSGDRGIAKLECAFNLHFSASAVR